MARLRPSWYLGTTLSLLAAACSDPLEPADLVGSYTATTFTVSIGAGNTVNALALGASVDIDLAADGTTAGQLVFPAIPGFSTQPLDVSLDGTYSVVGGDKVRFTHNADSFLQSLLFTADGRELRATYSFVDGQGQPGQVVITLMRG